MFSLSALTTIVSEAPPPSGGGLGMSLVPMILIMVMFYFLLIRPQRQQQKRLDAMRDKLAIGDKVVTNGGIHGLVTGVTDRTVSVKVADGVSVKFERSAISTVTAGRNHGDVEEDSADETEN